MGAEVENGIRLPNFLEVGVVSSKSMMGACTAGVQQAHRIAFVAKGGLDANENIAEMATKHQQVLSIAVEISRGFPPVLLQTIGVGRKALVFLNAHAMGNR